MRTFLVRRFISAILSLIGATFLVFVIAQSTQDPLLLYAKPGNYGISEEQKSALRKKLGLDRPVVIQYALWLGRAMKGDLGTSIFDELPVTKKIAPRIKPTLQVGISAWLFATVVGIPLGVLSAVKRASVWDYFGRVFALFGQAVPNFWLGIMMILIFAERLRWLPSYGIGDGEWFPWRHLVMPVIVLGTSTAAGYLRITRSSMLEILDAEFVKLARAKGVSNGWVIWKHALRNALIPPLTVSAVLMASFITGSLITETVFAIPGIGRLAVESVSNNDFPLLAGITLVFIAIWVAVNFVSDVLYVVVDPRDKVELSLMAQDRTETVEAVSPGLTGIVERSLPLKVIRFLRRWPVVPLAVLFLLVFTGVFAPWLAPHNPNVATSLSARNAPPSWYSQWYEEHPRIESKFVLGADPLGRDILSRLIDGARISLLVVAVALVVGATVGTALGLLSGYYGGYIDEVISRFWDIWAAIPFLLIALIIATVIGNTLWTVMGLLAMVSWSSFVRNVRAETLGLRERDYVLQSRIAGASTRRILWRHILPNLINTIVVIATLRVGGLILAEASLSFLGVGIPKPQATWGNMVADGRGYIADAWWVSFWPGLAIFLVVMSLNFLGDWLRDRWDPRLRQVNT